MHYGLRAGQAGQDGFLKVLVLGVELRRVNYAVVQGEDEEEAQAGEGWVGRAGGREGGREGGGRIRKILGTEMTWNTI